MATKWREHGRYWANKKPALCQMDGCDELKLVGRGYRYCAQHTAEGGKRESIQATRRLRERAYGLTA